MNLKQSTWKLNGKKIETQSKLNAIPCANATISAAYWVCYSISSNGSKRINTGNHFEGKVVRWGRFLIAVNWLLDLRFRIGKFKHWTLAGIAGKHQSELWANLFKLWKSAIVRESTWRKQGGNGLNFEQHHSKMIFNRNKPAKKFYQKTLETPETIWYEKMLFTQWSSRSKF